MKPQQCRPFRPAYCFKPVARRRPATDGLPVLAGKS
jgi:hypothetical protein